MMKIRQYILFLVVTGFLSCGQQEPEWQPLFNGQNTDGWVVKCIPTDKDKEYWTVSDSCIVANSLGDKNHDYVWLMTEKEYDDFIMKFKFQVFQHSQGNSGIQIRSRYDDKAHWLDGPQIDIHPPANWRTGMMWDETRGNKRWIYPDIPQGKWVDSTMREQPFPFYFANDNQAWNEMKITAEGMKITAFLNGVQITDFDGSGLLDDTNHKKYRVGQKGHIDLQIHTGDELKIRFKDLKIKEL